MKVLNVGLKGLLLMTCLTGTAVSRAEPFIVGVGSHSMNNLAQPLSSLQQARDAGISSVRDDAYWSTAEPAPNQLRIIPQWRSWLSTATSLDLTPMVILGYGLSPNGSAKPRKPDTRASFVNYVDYITRQLGKPVKFYEVWNEWDIEGPKDPRLSADYVAMVRAAAPAIRKNNPQARILAGGSTSAGIKGGFIDRIVEGGVLNYADGISIHPYVHCEGMGHNSPESWIKWLRNLSQGINAKAGKAVPLYLTEMGWPSHDGKCGISATQQAAYLARAYFLARTLPAIQGMWWYDLINDGKKRDEQEHNFGLLNENYTPKPAYLTLNAISPYLRDFNYDAEHSVQSDNVYKLAFTNGRERIMVAWATGRSRIENLSARSMQDGAVGMLDTQFAEKGMNNSSQRWSCSADSCSVSVTLTEFPKIIRMKPGA